MNHQKRNIKVEIIVWLVILPIYIIGIAFLILLALLTTLSQSPKRSVRMYRDMWRDRHKTLRDFFSSPPIKPLEQQIKKEENDGIDK